MSPVRFLLAVALLGALIARFRPGGMTLALVATAIAQVVVFLIARIAGFGFTGPITVFFAALWLTSAWLSRERRSGRILRATPGIAAILRFPPTPCRPSAVIAAALLSRSATPR